jgi:hypothetical protein
MEMSLIDWNFGRPKSIESDSACSRHFSPFVHLNCITKPWSVLLKEHVKNWNHSSTIIISGKLCSIGISKFQCKETWGTLCDTVIILTVQSIVVILCTTWFNIKKLCVLLMECICVFSTDLKINTINQWIFIMKMQCFLW